MSRILRRRAARQDLVDIFRHYAREAGLRVADRFSAEAEAAFLRLAGMPGLGARYEHEHPALAELRFLPLSRFPKYLVFYRPMTDGIEVLRVLHGARDIHGILAEELGLDEDEEEEEGAEEGSE
jgi:toxin ParE1/3/4